MARKLLGNTPIGEDDLPAEGGRLRRGGRDRAGQNVTERGLLPSSHLTSKTKKSDIQFYKRDSSQKYFSAEIPL